MCTHFSRAASTCSAPGHVGQVEQADTALGPRRSSDICTCYFSSVQAHFHRKLCYLLVQTFIRQISRFITVGYGGGWNMSWPNCRENYDDEAQ